jgi:hypothetical protein
MDNKADNDSSMLFISNGLKKISKSLKSDESNKKISYKEDLI